jgi:23S rRNA (guanosine2251-2'-O)-methyltransferase
MWIYGRNPVREALRAGHSGVVYVALGVEPAFLHELQELGAEVVALPRIDLDTKLRTTHHQGVMIEVVEPRLQDPDQALRKAKERHELPLLVLLDRISDPRNFGAILRTAEALGAHGVIIERSKSAPLSAVAIKASAGAATQVVLAQVANLPNYIKEIKEQGIWVYGTAPEAPKLLEQADFKRPLALVMGSEGEGMRRLVRERCDELFAITMTGHTASLNVAVALGITLYQAQLGRKP